MMRWIVLVLARATHEVILHKKLRIFSILLESINVILLDIRKYDSTMKILTS